MLKNLENAGLGKSSDLNIVIFNYYYYIDKVLGSAQLIDVMIWLFTILANKCSTYFIQFDILKGKIGSTLQFHETYKYIVYRFT